MGRRVGVVRIEGLLGAGCCRLPNGVDVVQLMDGMRRSGRAAGLGRYIPIWKTTNLGFRSVDLGIVATGWISMDGLGNDMYS
jgi:hypothetical protein